MLLCETRSDEARETGAAASSSPSGAVYYTQNVTDRRFSRITTKKDLVFAGELVAQFAQLLILQSVSTAFCNARFLVVGHPLYCARRP